MWQWHEGRGQGVDFHLQQPGRCRWAGGAGESGGVRKWKVEGAGETWAWASDEWSLTVELRKQLQPASFLFTLTKRGECFNFYQFLHFVHFALQCASLRGECFKISPTLEAVARRQISQIFCKESKQGQKVLSPSVLTFANTDNEQNILSQIEQTRVERIVSARINVCKVLTSLGTWAGQSAPQANP